MTDPQAYWTPERTAGLCALLDEMAEYDREEYADLLLDLALDRWCDSEEMDAALPGWAWMFAYATVGEWGFKVRSRRVDGRLQRMIV